MDPSNLDPSYIENLPIELAVNIIEQISSPSILANFDNTSYYLRTLTKKYVKKLSTDNITYLGIEWLNNFQALENVNDNIIFNINIDDEPRDINIPSKLTKFNLLLSSNRSIYDKYLIDDLKKIIANILSQVIDDLNIMTIRIYIQGKKLFNSFVLLIQENTIRILIPNFKKERFTNTETPYNLISSIQTNTGIFIGNYILNNNNNRYLKVLETFYMDNLLYIDDPKLILSSCKLPDSKELDIFMETGIINKYYLEDIIHQYNCNFLLDNKKILDSVLIKNNNYLYIASHLDNKYIDMIKK